MRSMSFASIPLVLVADDEPSMLELVARHLKTMSDPKIEVLVASDGEQAWRLAREHLPDLVVLDVMMPGMSGWEVCRKIREEVALAHTGVVMLTGIGENLNQLTSPLYGADAYIDKPFDFDELDRKVRGALDARAGQRAGVTRPRMNGVGGAAKPAKNVSSGGSSAPKVAKAKRQATKTAKVAKEAPAAPKKASTRSPAAAKSAAKKTKAAAKGAVKKAAKLLKKVAKLVKKAPKKVVAKKGPRATKGAAARNGAAKNGSAKRSVVAKRPSPSRAPAKPKRPAARKSPARRPARATR